MAWFFYVLASLAALVLRNVGLAKTLLLFFKLIMKQIMAIREHYWDHPKVRLPIFETDSKIFRTTDDSRRSR